MNGIEQRLDYADAVAEWLLDSADDCISRHQLEGALHYTALAVSVLCRQNRTLTHSRIEANLLQVAAHLPGGDRVHPKPGEREHCLHVMSEALPAGGHTTMATRWIDNDVTGRRHSVVLLRQTIAVPPTLLSAVADRGGKVQVADNGTSALERSAWLRRVAYEQASHVVLHVDTAEVICGVAFGVPGGPPVMLVNHAAHVYWTGASVVDLVLNCRGSALEGVWTTEFRGIPRHATLPIPLPDPPLQRQKLAARAVLGFPADAVIFLTVGASFKYLAMDDLDFVRTCERILAGVPRGIVIVAGFDGDSRWKAAASRTGGRIRTLGRRSPDGLALVREASDVYLEGFPFGTTTSLLESALARRPVVLAPAECPPPYGSDGVALDGVVRRPASVDDYVTAALRLAESPARRHREAEAVRRSVQEHHTGEGWRRYLEIAVRSLPPSHATYPPVQPARTPESIYQHWARFVPHWTWGYEQTLENVVYQAYAAGLKPRLTTSLRKACRRARQVRSGHTVPAVLLSLLCNHLLVRLTTPWDLHVFRLVAAVLRGSLLTRIRQRTARALGLGHAPRGAYQEYREEAAYRG